MKKSKRELATDLEKLGPPGEYPELDMARFWEVEIAGEGWEVVDGENQLIRRPRDRKIFHIPDTLLELLGQMFEIDDDLAGE